MEETKRKTALRSAGPDTPTRIRDVAEQLFADHGIEAVSLRQIATSAAAGNNNTVQYYFGDKEGLVRAIIEGRLPQIDARRAVMFGKLSAGEVDDPDRLLDIMLRPIAAFTDDRGKYRWAAFLLAIDNAPSMMAIRIGADPQAPVTAMIRSRLLNALAPWSSALAHHRLLTAFRSFFRGLVAIDRDFGTAPAHIRAALIEDLLALAKAIVKEPAAPDMIAAMSDD